MEKKRYLEANADRVREGRTVPRPLDDGEKARLRFDLQNVSIELSNIQKEYKEVQKEFREKINDMKESVESILSQLKQGFEEVTGTTYEIRDYEGERVYEILEDGTQVDNRPMLPDERQSTVQSEMRKVENDG